MSGDIATWVGSVGTCFAAVGIFAIAGAELYERRTLRKEARKRACAILYTQFGRAVASLLVCQLQVIEMKRGENMLACEAAIRGLVGESKMSDVSAKADLGALDPEMVQQVLLAQSVWEQTQKRFAIWIEPNPFSIVQELEEAVRDLDHVTRDVGELIWKTFQPNAQVPWKRVDLGMAVAVRP